MAQGVLRRAVSLRGSCCAALNSIDDEAGFPSEEERIAREHTVCVYAALGSTYSTTRFVARAHSVSVRAVTHQVR